jgi:hypothetical protein
MQAAEYPQAPDFTAIDDALAAAGEHIAKYRMYEQNLKRAAELEVKTKELRALEADLKTRRDSRQAVLATATQNSRVPGLGFTPDGSLVFENTAESMLSDSQKMRLSSLLSSLYPQGLGLELIDRAESLGTSVFAFVDKARREEKTILASIVGEHPAVVQDEIGVFVVANGEVKPV